MFPKETAGIIPPGENRANARLLTASPEMLEALQLILLDLDSGFIAQESVRAERARRVHENRIRTIIARAQG